MLEQQNTELAKAILAYLRGKPQEAPYDANHGTNDPLEEMAQGISMSVVDKLVPPKNEPEGSDACVD